jgi:hypothetical protein
LSLDASAAIKRELSLLPSEPTTEMADPKNYREVAIDLEAFKREISPQFEAIRREVTSQFDGIRREVGPQFEAITREVTPQFAHLNTMVRWILATVIGAAASGGFALYKMTSDVNSNIAVLFEKVGSLDRRLENLERGATPSQAAIRASLDHIERSLGGGTPGTPPRQFTPTVALPLTPDEVQTIRELLSVKGPVTDGPGFAIGDRIPEAILKPVPPSLVEKVPKLKGAKYASSNGYAVLTGADNLVIAIIAPA